MKLIITVLLLWLTQAANLYLQKLGLWRQKVPMDSIHTLKQFSSDAEMCEHKPCEIYYFIAQNTDISKQEHANLTVLLVSGLRGDDSVSPNILLDAFGTLNAARTIFLPLANPSGIAKGSRQTSPGNIDIEKDFPLGESQCNRTAAVKSLSYLFRTYPIDLTIYVHDGKPSFSFSWGQKYQDGTDRVEDFGIYTDIANMVRYYGNDSAMTAGPLYELKQLENVGKFIDWAYGASKYPSILSRTCRGQKVTALPELAMNGLVFALGVGKTEAEESPQGEKQPSKGFKLIEKIIEITNPKMNVAITDKDILLTLSGCKTGSLTSIKISSDAEDLIFEKSTETIVKGDVTFGSAPAATISLPQDTVLPNSIRYKLEFQCDNGWLNLGKTAFSKLRTFQQSGTISLKNEQEQKNQLPILEKTPSLPSPHLPISTEQKKQGWNIFIIVGIVLVIAFGVGWMINGIRLGLKVQRTQRIKNFDEKFEIVEIVEDAESFSNNFGEKEAPEILETKQGQQQDGDHTRLNPNQ